MLRAADTPPRRFTLVLLSGLAIVSLNMFLPSLSSIAETFRADYALVNLSIAGYAAMTAVLQLVMGPLSDRFGRRPVILAALLIFSAASVGCLLADDIWTFLLFRMLQGAVIAGHTVSLAVIRDSWPAQKAASVMGYVAMAWAVAPLLAPMVGGTLDALFGWRASFWAFLGLGAAVFALCWSDLGETNKTPSATFTDQVQTYPALFRSRRFWGYALCTAFSLGAFYTFLSGAPLVARTVFGMPPASVGVAIGTITGGFILGSFLSGRFAAHHALTTMMIAGRLIACAGMVVGLAFLAAGVVHPVTLFGACVFVGIGNGLTMPSSNAGAMSVRPKLAGSASGLSGALAVAGGAVMSALTGAILT
ncbi:MAG: multidrug effflux MFS transporter, partial [Alphaproteobacteria bacterium]|nr:multidrug effflux MFS transporter [Alphaproteobacteria bacterium]